VSITSDISHFEFYFEDQAPISSKSDHDTWPDHATCYYEGHM